MDKAGILLRIKQALPWLPKQERKVGDYILNHPQEVVRYSITELAELSHVSTTTVSRFCKRLRLEGYGHLRIALAREWGSPDNLVYVQPRADDTLADIAQKIFAANIQALQDTQKTLDLEILKQIVEAIWQARRVDIYAMGGAGIAARDLHFKCIQLGLNTSAFLDTQMQVMSAASLTPRDVGIGISHTGMQHQVAEALRLAREGGATTVALTSYPSTPVSEAADIVLLTTSLAAAITYDSPTVRTAQLAIVDVVYEALLLTGQEQALGNMARVAKAISDHTIGSNVQT